MSRDNDLESDSPKSRQEINETRDDTNLDEPLNEQQLYETKENNSRIVSDYLYFETLHREGGIEIHTTLHETFPPLFSIHIPFSDNPIQEVSGPSASKTADLVRQPSR